MPSHCNTRADFQAGVGNAEKQELSAIYTSLLRKPSSPLWCIWHSGLMLLGCAAELPPRCHNASYQPSKLGTNKWNLSTFTSCQTGKRGFHLLSGANRPTGWMLSVEHSFTHCDLSHRKALNSDSFFHPKLNRNMDLPLQPLNYFFLEQKLWRLWARELKPCPFVLCCRWGKVIRCSSEGHSGDLAVLGYSWTQWQ